MTTITTNQHGAGLLGSNFPGGLWSAMAPVVRFHNSGTFNDNQRFMEIDMNKEEIAKEIKTCEDRLADLRKKLEEPEFNPLLPGVYLGKCLKGERFDRIIVAGTEQTDVYNFAGEKVNTNTFVTNGNVVKLGPDSAIAVYYDLTALPASNTSN